MYVDKKKGKTEKEERNETEEHLVETVGRSPVAASVD
jgi:hypothetical protein